MPTITEHHAGQLRITIPKKLALALFNIFKIKNFCNFGGSF